MKTTKTLLLGIIVCTTFSFYSISDIINQLGLTHQTTQYYILRNLIGDFQNQSISESSYFDDGSVNSQLKSFKIPKAPNLTAIISGDKKAATIEFCQYIKDYVNSQEFIDEYQSLREKTKPTSEPYRMSASEIQTMEKGIIDAEKAIKANAAYMTADQKSELQKNIDLQKKEIQNMKDPTPNKTNWEKMYPEDPEILVKNCLNEYLNLVATVDFDAKLTQSGKHKKFTNPDYEKKSLKWKAIYRAGKEANTVATTFVKEWLKGDVISDVKIKLITDQVNKSNSQNNQNNTTPTEETKPLEKVKEKKNKLLNKIGGKLGL